MNMIEPALYRTPPTSAGGRSIGAILVDTGRLSADNAERILRLQKERGQRFGDAAIELGLLSEDDVRFALSSQFDYPYLPSDDNSLSHELVAAYAPFSPVVEQLRTLRSQLMLRWFETDANGMGMRNVLTIVSPGSEEGRSFIAANLAVVFSQLGERTLLIDADLRKPSQHRLFKLGRNAGLSGLLAGHANIEVVVRVPSLLKLSVLPAGAVPPNPQELLGRPTLAAALRALSSDFDVIIIDTPAATEYADAQTIALRSGASLMVARKNRSSLRDLTQLTHQLRLGGTKLIGTVLNEA